MANLVIEFDIRKPSESVFGSSATLEVNKVVKHVDEKICRFTIYDCRDDIAWQNAGDEIGFDLTESNEYFYVTVSRKVYLVGSQRPIFVICVPRIFDDMDELTATLKKFKAQFRDSLEVDT